MSRSDERLNGRVVYDGLTRHEKLFAMGWDAGYSDGVEGLPRDSTLAVEVGWYGNGYRDGYALARPEVLEVESEPEDETLVRVATLAFGG